MNNPCIVGWAHTRLRQARPTRPRSPDPRRGAAGHRPARAWSPSDIDGVFVGHFNAGFVRQDFSASLVAVAIPELRHTPAVRIGKRLRHRVGGDLGRARRARRRPRAPRPGHRPGEDERPARPRRSARPCCECSYVAEEGDTPGGFAGIFGRIASSYFERYRRPERRAGRDRGQEPRERRRQPLCPHAARPGLRFLPPALRQEPVRRRPAEALRLLAGVRRRRGPGARPTEPLPGAAVPAVRWRSRTQVNDFLPLSRRDPTRFEGAAMAWQRGLAAADMHARRPAVRRDARLLHDRRIARVRGHGPGAARARARA